MKYVHLICFRKYNIFVVFIVIDFEKCAYGPAGLDLGMFLANFMW